MKMNKLISIVMAALLVCSLVVTGCGSRGGNRGNNGADEVEFNGMIDPDSIPEMTITFAHLDVTDPKTVSAALLSAGLLETDASGKNTKKLGGRRYLAICCQQQ